jgi:hypothetical protein
MEAGFYEKENNLQTKKGKYYQVTRLFKKSKPKC